MTAKSWKMGLELSPKLLFILNITINYTQYNSVMVSDTHDSLNCLKLSDNYMGHLL